MVLPISPTGFYKKCWKTDIFNRTVLEIENGSVR